MRFCLYYVQSPEAAEEIVSEVFIKCWNNRKTLINIERPETYMFVAVKNQSLKYCKKFSSIHLVELESTDEWRMMDLADPAQKLERKELHHQLNQAIETLPPQARMVFKLIKEDGLKYKEVAEILAISPRTVQTQLFRAIDKLRKALSSYKVASQHNTQDKLLNVIILVTLSLLFL